MAENNEMQKSKSSLIGNQAKPTVLDSTTKLDIDTKKVLIDDIIEAGLNSTLDTAALERFTAISNSRDQVYQLIDTMCQDSAVSSIVRTYTEDVCEPSDSGHVVWCESPNPKISKFVNYLLNVINVDKNIFSWVYCLIKYGDVYLRLYRNSEYNDDLFDKKEKKPLNEDVIIKAYSEDDSYSHYIEMVPNPAEMFELTRFGKSYAYIRAIHPVQAKYDDMMYASYYRYSFKKNDVEIYDATNFVHACLDDNSSRTPEEVEIFMTDKDYENKLGSRYTVKRGQSILYKLYKIWREMSLLENSLLLNRLTKSSIVRLISVNVGDMPKENVRPHLLGIKQMMEQKSAIDVGNNMAEYNNAGPVENNVYIPVHGEVGSISTQTIGGDVDVKGLADVDFFKNKLYAGLAIPKQFLGDTDDATGFNGGTSLTLISSRYAKTIKRIQNTIIQAITDAINLILIDRGLDRYINKFTINMQAPTTQEEIDRRDNQNSYINMIQDIMNLVDNDIESPADKLRILKALLSDTVSNEELFAVIQENIDRLDAQIKEEEITAEDDNVPDIDIDNSFSMPGRGRIEPDFDLDLGEEPNAGEAGAEGISGEETILPTPGELGAGDFSDMNNAEL